MSSIRPKPLNNLSCSQVSNQPQEINSKRKQDKFNSTKSTFLPSKPQKEVTSNSKLRTLSSTFKTGLNRPESNRITSKGLVINFTILIKPCQENSAFQ